MKNQNLQKRVELALTGSFADGKAVLETGTNGDVHGLFVSGSFERQTDRERQQALWAALHRAIAPEELTHVRFVLASTPAEYQAVSDYPLNDD